VKNNNLLEVPNINSKDAKLKKLIYDVDNSLFNVDNYSKEKFEHLCVCSGGTTSSCAKNGFTTLDLRKNHSKIHLDRESNLVTIGGGVLMGDLVNYLQKHNRSFPIGLSKLPGAGYILTGGVSPLSRAYGLAIDNIESIKGFLGNGTFISFKKNQINPEEQLIWEAIKGAAPFFSIITEIELKTIQSNSIKVIEGFVNLNELTEIIKLSEEFPENISLQWIYAQKIYIYIFAELKNNLEDKRTKECLMLLNKFPTLEKQFYENFNKINFFPKQLNLYELNANNHSEVISLLGEDLKKENVSALKEGMVNLRRHINNIRKFGLPVTVAVNHFITDTEDEMKTLLDFCETQGVKASKCTHWSNGSEGTIELAKNVTEICEDKKDTFKFLYEDDLPLFKKIEKIAQEIYSASEVVADTKVRQQLKDFEEKGYGKLPVCIAKTQYSFSTDPNLKGAPTGHVLPVREVRLSSGAEFIVVVCGEIMTMPGLPRVPAADSIKLNDKGEIEGLF